MPCTTVIFLDANVPMYAGGAEHRLKRPCIRVLELVRGSPSQFATSAEVLQELIHRYIAVRRWPVGRELFADFAALLTGRVHPIFVSDVLLAAEFADQFIGLSARDLLHTAVMRRLEINRIVSTDIKFDNLPHIERLDPMLVEEWRESVVSGDIP